MGSSLYRIVGSLKAYGKNPEEVERHIGMLHLTNVTLPQVTTAFGRVSNPQVRVSRTKQRLDGYFANLFTRAPELTDQQIHELMEDMNHHLTAIKQAADDRIAQNLREAGLGIPQEGSVADRQRQRRPVRRVAQRSIH